MSDLVKNLREAVEQAHDRLNGRMDIMWSLAPYVTAAADRIEQFNCLEQELVEVLEFYANQDRYDYDETCCPVGETGEDILSDCGSKAHAILAKHNMSTTQEED